MSRKVNVELELADGCEGVSDDRIAFGVYQAVGGKTRVKSLTVLGEAPPKPKKKPEPASTEPAPEG